MSYIAGSEMTGTEAHHWGWANRAVPAEELESVTMTMARSLIFGAVEITLPAWRDRSRTLADGRVRQGMQPDDRVVLYVGSRQDFLFLHYACFIAGGVVMPLNRLYRPEEIEHAVRQCEADYVIAEAATLDRFLVSVIAARRCGVCSCWTARTPRTSS